jgi:hypothetical protein
MSDKAIYITTDKAGRRVAGRIMRLDADGKPKVGQEMELTAAEAEYELSQGVIEPKPVADAPKAKAKAAAGENGDASKSG